MTILYEEEKTHVKFPKINRMFREMVITEKIDGTNAQIVFTPDDEMLCGSRKRWVTPESDNFGFARWCYENRDALFNELGYGRHFGEWWGSGIQRNYGLKEKRFSLFNINKWADAELNLCYVVPVLYKGMYDTNVVRDVLANLKENGSQAVKGFMKPEGVVVYHTQANSLLKITIENDEIPKSLAK